MAFINKGINKSNIASMILINGPRAILRMLCLYESDTFLIIHTIISRNTNIIDIISLYNRKS